ncbi:MAG: methyltransferase domain-containing protein [Chitinophagaceae bacterium]|nr:methyltransferase domain-containing protein [Chitinophagaceae bacterium]
MEIQNQPSAPVRAFMILGGMMNSQVVSALIKTNIFESLASEPRSTDELTGTCHVNQNVLSRTLRYAAFIGLINYAEGKYSLTDVGRCFLKNVPGSLYGSASFISAPPWRDSWNNFTHCLESGLPAFDHVMGKPFFEFLNTNEEYGKPFNNYMTMMTTMTAPVVVESYDFSVFKTICDVGGGQGILLKAILEKAPHTQGILFDMESAMKQHVLSDFMQRVQFVSGSFFEAIPAADCLILKTVIHDWNDENAQKILSNCRNALTPGGKIILVEQVVEEPFTLMSLFYDLHMQVMLGGSERTEGEFRKLFESSGLKLNRIIPTKSPMKIIEASC